MPTATLTFSLPEEREEYLCAVAAGEMHSALGEIRHMIRQREKHGEPTDKRAEELLSEIRGMVAEALVWEQM